MTIHNYRRVTVTRRTAGQCPICGKRVTRTRTFEQTVNPFHRAVQNAPADASLGDLIAAVRESVEREADGWMPNFIHGKCEGALNE